MNTSAVINRLRQKYPGKQIVLIPVDEPTEILCEVDPCVGHPEFSRAISVIDRTAPHVHKKTVETYTVLEGELDVSVDGVVQHLEQGQALVIRPDVVHFAIGDETWVECYSEPGWTSEDHILT